MMKLSASERRTAIIGLSFILIFSFVYWVVIPVWNEYETVGTELKKLKNTENLAESTASMEQSFAEKCATYEQAFAKLKVRYISDVDDKTAVIQFLSLVEHLTKTTKVEIVSETTGINQKEGYKSVNVNLTVRCTAAQLTDLLQTYRNAKTAISVDRLRIDLEEQNQMLQVRLTASTLIIGEEGEADAPKQ